jgi:hypothetical protein
MIFAAVSAPQPGIAISAGAIAKTSEVSSVVSLVQRNGPVHRAATPPDCASVGDVDGKGTDAHDELAGKAGDGASGVGDAGIDLAGDTA